MRPSNGIKETTAAGALRLQVYEPGKVWRSHVHQEIPPREFNGGGVPFAPGMPELSGHESRVGSSDAQPASSRAARAQQSRMRIVVVLAINPERDEWNRDTG